MIDAEDMAWPPRSRRIKPRERWAYHRRIAAAAGPCDIVRIRSRAPAVMDLVRVRCLRLCVVAGAVAAGCARGTDDRSGDAIAVTTAVVEVGAITAVVQADGVVTVAPGGEQIVTAPEPARIVDLPKSEREPVVRGDVLVRLELVSVQSDAARQTADISRAEARVESARAAHSRAIDLFERGLVPRLSLDELGGQVSAAEADLRSAREAASTLEAAAASRSMVRAVLDGVVRHRFVHVGDVVTPESPILTVLDPRRLEVTTSVPFRDAIRINVGNAARVVTAAEGAAPSGLRVVSRPESASDRAAPVAMRLAFNETPSIPVGAAVQLAINGESRDAAALVPLSAVAQENGGTTVYVVVNGRVERRVVSVGITDDDHAEITAGLQRGEVVVIESQTPLFEGAKITVGSQSNTR
jgi:RND family efflux transporter MFP subunit